jgi:hypothetical protein
MIEQANILAEQTRVAAFFASKGWLEGPQETHGDWAGHVVLARQQVQIKMLLLWHDGRASVLADDGYVSSGLNPQSAKRPAQSPAVGGTRRIAPTQAHARRARRPRWRASLCSSHATRAALTSDNSFSLAKPCVRAASERSFSPRATYRRRAIATPTTRPHA